MKSNFKIKKYITLIIVIVMAFSIVGCEKSYNEEKNVDKEFNENETKTIEIYNESNSENKYYEYIETSLLKEINLPELNEFQVKDNNMKVDIDSKNFGLISALICDLDNDEKKELLCVVSEKSNECDTIIDLRIYKIVNNEVKLIDSLQEDKKIKIIGAQNTTIFLENNNIYVSSFGGSLSFTNRFSSFKVIKYEDNKLSLIKDYLIRRVVGYRTISELSSNKIYYNGDENDTASIEKAYEELKKDLKEVNLERCLVYYDDDERIEQYGFIYGTEDNTSDVLIFESEFNSSDYVSSYSRFFKDYTNLRDKIKIEKQTNNKENNLELEEDKDNNKQEINNEEKSVEEKVNEAKNLIMNADKESNNSNLVFLGLKSREELINYPWKIIEDDNSKEFVNFEIEFEDYSSGGNYLVGLQSKKVYRIPNQGGPPAYLIEDNKKIKNYEYISN